MLLNYREYGAGVATAGSAVAGGLATSAAAFSAPLLILHGLFGSLENWHTVALRLSGTRRVVSVDLRNHGDSPHSSDFTYPLLASDVIELIGRLGFERVALLGHSMGGKTAMELALSRSDLLERLIVIDIAPKRYLPRHEDLRDAMLSVDLSAIRSRREAEAVLAQRISDQPLRLFLLKNLRRDDSGGFHWRLDLASISASFANLWTEIDGGRSYAGPTLFLRGGLSTYILDEDLPVILRSFPAARFETIEGAGHWLQADQPEALIQAVERFCSGG